ncbi:MAG: putative Zn-dependent protease [Cellvibrionaceae bacterium]|jgi:predicted Zn-dependent protease
MPTRYWYRKLHLALPFIVLLLTTSTGSSANNGLPSIGKGASAASLAEEKRLGQTWLRLYRRQVPISSDPYLIDYTEALLQRLAKENQAAGDEFSLVIVRNDALNAFAVPGGIIGVNTGLYNYAQTEDQFASVLAHELAHLSQRHYARRVEQQKGQQLLGMAALLGSLIIAATGGGDAGIAAIQATQAGIIDQQLRFSRSFEEEADRIGMTALVNAGFDAHSMADMFQQMQRASQFSSEPPEFLLTHPVTARRIADAENRSRSFPRQNSPSSLDYDLIRSRVLFKQEESPQQAIARFESELKGFSPSKEGSRYGLVLAFIAAKEFDKASSTLKPLFEQFPEHPNLISAQADIDAGNKNLNVAIARIETALEKNPNSYPLNSHYSRLLATNSDFNKATDVLNSLRLQRPQDPFVWYQLAEIAGLAGDILTLHKARAEYFILYGDFDSADNQLNNIIKKFSQNKNEVSIAKQRLKELKRLRETSVL